MDLFSGVIPFVAVAESGGFRKAAAQLGLTAAAISKSIAKLEEELGVTLVHRTSRTVSLTAEGQEYLTRCREAVSLMKGAREAVEGARSSPEGVVRVSASLILGAPVVHALAAVALRHPRLRFDLTLSDRVAKLAEEDIDIAVRVGEAHDQTLTSRLLASPAWSTVASPAYLARKRAPVDDLTQHDVVAFSGPRGVLRTFQLPDRKRLPEARMTVDHGERLVDAALAGLGIVQVLDFMAAQHLAAGRLVEVFPATPGPTIRALCLPRRARAPRVRAVLDALVDAFRAAI
jgi:LysR family transcriptional regulator, regulator for bpeEF and oprC